MFPAGESYELSCGKKVHIHAWSLETIALVAQRFPDMIERVQKMSKEDPDGNAVEKIMPQAIDEVVWCLHASIPELDDVDIAKELPADDVLGLTLAVYDKCMAGPLLKLAALSSRARNLMAMAGISTTSEVPSSS